MTSEAKMIGPILILDDLGADRMHLSALVVAPVGVVPPPFQVDGQTYQAKELATYSDLVVWRARFVLAAAQGGAGYEWNGTFYEVAADLSDDARLAYVSCNGEEHGDLSRNPDERNVMWRRLADLHRAAPFSIVMHGGDQVYADEVMDDHPLSAGWPTDVPDSASETDLEDLHRVLREGFAQRYITLYRQADIAWMMARVPSLMQWDDHDICDGWGSLPDRVLTSDVGQAVFAAAREAALIFQHGCRDGDLPARFHDPNGGHLGWAVETPDLHILAPDLRSNRTMTRVMGEDGWTQMEDAAAAPPAAQTFLMSSVPLLGPRLSLVERLMRWLPGIQKYEDDLRDQWQSRAHRASWIRMLGLVSRIITGGDGHITVISGEIHLATRAEMAIGPGKTLHQLVASGITHRAPPKGWARILGALASLGEDPIPDRPIRIRPLPGKDRRYTAERNALVLHRKNGVWFAVWVLEETGLTPPMMLH